MPIDVHDGQQLREGDDGEARGAEGVKHGQPVLARPRSKHQTNHVTETRVYIYKNRSVEG